jgi:radical SAM-linked protein
MTFAVTGRARFLSHLETVDMLLSALRRAGYEIALSHGPKPRPVIALAFPRAVGVEACADLADVELVGDHDPAEVAGRLAGQLPEGIDVHGIVPAAGRPAASLVHRLVYTADVSEDLDWDAAGEAFAAAPEAVVVRRAPDKADKRVDVKRSCTGVTHERGRLRFEIELSEAGAARPEEIVKAVAAGIGATPTIGRLVRTRIELRDQPAGVTQ